MSDHLEWGDEKDENYKKNIYDPNTAGFMKTVPSVYSLLMNTVYLFHSTHR